MEISINLNDRVRVKLTARGREALLEHIGPLTSRKPEESADISYKGWRDGFVETQLWDLFNIFGDGIYMGSRAMFEENTIVLL
jgi:hypothetical protein